MEKRHHEFAELVRRTTESLMDETPPISLPNAVCELVVSVQPTFANRSSWAVFASGGDADFVVRMTTWDKTFDQRRFFDPLEGLKFGWHTAPTITTQIASLIQTELSELFERGRTFRSEPENQRGIVLDGVMWVLKWHAGLGDRLLSWNQGSAERQEIVRWTEQVAVVLERAFVPSTS